jgi:hypothetical protein
LASLLTLLALLIALEAVDLVSRLVVLLSGAAMLIYVIPLGILARKRRGRPLTAAVVVALAPALAFVAAVVGFSEAYGDAHENRGPGPGYADLADFFATSAQIVVGLLVVIALEGRPLDPPEARVLHRHGLIQVMLGGGVALLALALSEDLQVQAFAAIIVTGSLAAGLVAIVLLGAFRLSDSEKPRTS